MLHNRLHKLKHTLIMVRNFLFGALNREFLIFLFFLALSGVFWLLLTLNETYEEEFPVCVRLKSVPRNVIITGELTDTALVTIKDKGYSLVAYKWWHIPHPISFQFSTYATADKGRGSIPVADIQKQVYSQLASSSRITQIKPDKFGFYFNYGLSKRVPVRLDGHMTAGKSYYVARTAFWPDHVTIYASKHMLDSIKWISTTRVSLSNIEDTVYRQVALQKMTGVKVVPASVKMGVFPDIMIEETMEVPVVAVNMPEGQMLRTFPSKVKVKFSVGASLFRTIKPNQFKVVADYKDIAANPSDKCTLSLKGLPHSVSKAQLVDTQVDYLIEQQ